MSNQQVEKNQTDEQSESNPIVDNTEAQKTDDDYGLKKLTIYTVMFSLTCLIIAGTWYKKDEIPFAEISDISIEIYDESSKFIAENYNTIMSSLVDEETVITDTATIHETPESEVSLSDDTVENATPVSTTLAEDKATEVISEPATVVDTTEDKTITTDLDVINIEATTENIAATDSITEAVVITESAIEEVNKTDVITTEINTGVADINVTDVTGNDIATTDVIAADATEAKVTVTETETEEIKAVIETADTVKTDYAIEVKEPVKTVTAQVFNRRPAQGMFQVPRGYAPAPYRYNGPAANMPFNNMAKNNMPRNFMPQNNRMFQQPQTFEQNRQMQQQMMQQAIKMQSAIFKDADRRHQEMLKRVAEWKAQVQERRDAANARYNRPSYMN